MWFGKTYHDADIKFRIFNFFTIWVLLLSQLLNIFKCSFCWFYTNPENNSPSDELSQIFWRSMLGRIIRTWRACSHSLNIYWVLTFCFVYWGRYWASCFIQQNHGPGFHGTSNLMEKMHNQQYTQTDTCIYFIMSAMKQKSWILRERITLTVVVVKEVSFKDRWDDICTRMWMIRRMLCKEWNEAF